MWPIAIRAEPKSRTVGKVRPCHGVRVRILNALVGQLPDALTSPGRRNDSSYRRFSSRS